MQLCEPHLEKGFLTIKRRFHDPPPPPIPLVIGDAIYDYKIFTLLFLPHYMGPENSLRYPFVPH